MKTQPNIILITVECWRADYLGTPTPNIAQLAQESSVFSNACTAGGWTRIAMTALMSSAWASMHGGPVAALASPDRQTLAESLLRAGYWTGGFTANPACGGIAGFHRGFGDFRDCYRKPPLPRDAPEDWRHDWEQLLELGIPPRDAQNFFDSRALTDLALRWLRALGDRSPYFLWLHYFDPHWPCQMATRPSSPEELREAWEDIAMFLKEVIPAQGRFDPGPAARERWIGRYRENLAFTDGEIGRLFAALRARADWDRTLVAVTGDHGEEFFERGTWHHAWNQLYREGVHVPLVIRWPGVTPRQIADPVSLIDIAPTLLDFAEIPAPSAMLGSSLRPSMEEGTERTDPVYTEMMGHSASASYRLAIREREWKYRYDMDDPHNSTLFHVASDPDERVNVRSRFPDVFRRFEELRLAHTSRGLVQLMRRNEMGPASADPFTALGDLGDDALREQLEALGYI